MKFRLPSASLIPRKHWRHRFQRFVAQRLGLAAGSSRITLKKEHCQTSNPLEECAYTLVSAGGRDVRSWPRSIRTRVTNLVPRCCAVQSKFELVLQPTNLPQLNDRFRCFINASRTANPSLCNRLRRSNGICSGQPKSASRSNRSSTAFSSTSKSTGEDSNVTRFRAPN